MATSKLTQFDGKLDDEQPASTLTLFTGQLDGEKPRTRGLFEAVNDNVIEFANAAAGGVSALANFVKPGNAVSGFIDENIIKAGEQKQSDVVQGAKRQLSQGLDSAQGIGDEVGAVGSYVLNNPLLAASQAAGSFALPGGAVKGAGAAAKALGAGAKGIETAGRVGGISAGAAMAGGDAAGTAYDLASKAGATEDQAIAAGRQASVIPALVGGVTGAFGAERLLAGAKGFGGNALSRGLKSGLSEAGQEALEEGVTQFEGQRAAMPYDESIDPTKGVAGAAAMGGIMGFGPGAVLGAMGGGPELPSKQMGIDPNAGPLSRAAASAVDSQPVPPAGGMGFNPDAGATTVFPDGSQSINSEMPQQSEIIGTSTAVVDGKTSTKINRRDGSVEIDGVQVVPPSQPLAAEKKPAPVAPVSESIPLEQRSLDELRQAFRSAQDPAIRKTLAAEIRKRREAMPDPLAKPQQEIALEPQTPKAVQSQPQEAQAPAKPAELGQPLTDTGTNMLGRGADPLQSIIQGQADARRAADELRGTTGASTVTGGDITPPSVESPVADVRSTGRNDDAGTAQPDAGGDAGRAVGSTAEGSAALRPEGWRTTAIKAGKVARSLGLDPKGKRLKEIVAEIDAVDAGSGVAAKPAASGYEAAKSIRDAADARVNKASEAMQKYPRGAMGLTHDDVKASPQWKADKAEMDAAMRDLQNANATIAKNFAKEYRAERDAKRAAQVNVQNTPSSTAGTEAKASPVEARAPEGGNAASDTGVPAAGGNAGVRADGVNLSKNPRELNTSAEPVQKTSKNEQVAQAKTEAPAENKFAEYDALARQYGYEVRPDGSIGSDGKFPGVTMSVKKGRLRIEGKSGNLLASYAPLPESLGKFLESFWYAEKKKPAAQAEKPAEPVNPEPSKAVQPKAEKPAEPYDAARAQELRNSIAEGELIISSGTNNGRKLTKPQLDAVRRSVDSSRSKLAELDEDDAFMGVKKDEPRNLVAMHNLTADNLLYAESIGGIPVPSIGITKIDSPFNGFGDVTLIAPSSMVDPEQGTPVFDRDAWTARFPTMNFKKVKAKVSDAFYERMKPVDGMGNDGGQFLSMLWEETRNASVQRPDKVADLFRRYNAPKMLYAKEVLSKEIKVPMRAARLSSPAAEDKQLQAYWKKHGNSLIALEREMSGFDFSNSTEYKALMSEIEGAVRRYAVANDKADRADSYVEMFLPDGQLGPGGFNRLRKDFEQVGTKEVDGVKLSEAVRKAVPDNDPAYQRWVKSLVEPLFEAPTITVRGKEVAPTLENIVDAMTVGATAGAEKSLTFGPGKTAAMLGKRFKSMAEIKADRDRVVSQDQESEGKKATEAILDQYRSKATAFFKGTDWRGNIDTWAANDASMEALAKAGKAGGSNADIRQALVRAGFKQVDQTTVDLASESIKALRNAATDYFEAKPQRAVKLNEFRAAVVPKGVSQEVKDVLTKNGIEVVEYNKKTEGARDAAIQKTAKRVDKAAKDILFMGDKAKAQRQGTPVDRAIMDMAAEGREANEILSFIAKSSKSPYNRELAKKLIATGANPAVSLGGEMGGGAGFRFLAKYSRKSHEVTLSEAAADRAEQIFLHETVHAATLLALDKGGLIATQMRRLAANVYKDASPEMRKMYGLVLDKRTGEVNVGEFVAEAFTNPQFQKALKGMKADNGSLWNRLVNIVRRILGMEPRQQDALSKALELGAGVMSENMPLRAARSFRAEDGPAFAGADQTETPEFKRWFAGSKVVDADGKPLRVFHGTKGDFSAFDAGKLGQNTGHPTAGLGFFFSADPGVSDLFTEQIDETQWPLRLGQATGANTMPVYLAITKPFEMTMEQFRAIDTWPFGPEFEMEQPKAAARQRSFIAQNRAKMIEAGYDGIRVKGDPSMADTLGADEWRADTWVAFRPEQIKSAIGNNGNFDPDDADIAHFGMADAVEQIKAFDVKEAPKNTWAHYRGMALQALGRRQLVDLYGDEFGTHLHEYDTLVQQMDAEKNETGAEADDIAQRWGKLKDEKALAELMHDATLAKMDPDKPMPAGYSKAEYDKLKTRFNTLSPEAKTLYREARDMYVAHYKAVQQAIKDRIERSEMSPSEKKRMMAQLDDKLFKELQGVYFPLARFGQYVIVVKDANGEVKNVTRAETVKEAEQARKELQKAFPAHMGNTVGKVLKQAEFNAGRDAVGKGFMADLMNALDEKGVDDELRDTVAQLYLSSLPDLSWAKHGIHRKGTPGFSQDARRAFAQNAFHGARYLAKLRYSDRLQDELTGMQEYVKAFEGVEEYDSIQGQQVVDEMVKRHEILMNPKSSPVSTALTSFGFLFHMGLSPASAMVNLTQTALVAYPQMGAKWGFGKAGAALTKASEEVVRAKNDLSKSLKGDELAAFDRAVKDGTIDVTMAHDLAGIAQGEDQGVMWKVRPVMRWASFMFHHAEKFNRQATFLAAYRLSKETNQGRSEDWHYEEAKKATYDGHFDYSAANRARVMQGNWQRVILLFKQYSQSMIYTLARNAYLSVKAIDPKERTQARKTLGGILAAHAAAAGVLGLPIVGPLLTVASWIGGDDDEPWDAEIAMQNAMAEMIGPKAAEVVARGFSRLTPFDLSGRVALNKLILPDVQEGLEGKEWAESAMAAALGPVAGIGVNMARGAQKITEGDYLRGMEDMMPTALRGPLKALRYANEGAVDKTGIVITDEVSAAGVLGQASGFSPSQVRRDTERRSAIYAYDRALLERRSVLMRMMAEARIQGDEEAAAEVQKDIQRFNEKNPNRRITPMNIAQSIRNRRKRIDEAEQGVYLPSKRRDALDAVSF